MNEHHIDTIFPERLKRLLGLTEADFAEAYAQEDVCVDILKGAGVSYVCHTLWPTNRHIMLAEKGHILYDNRTLQLCVNMYSTLGVTNGPEPVWPRAVNFALQQIRAISWRLWHETAHAVIAHTLDPRGLEGVNWWPCPLQVDTQIQPYRSLLSATHYDELQRLTWEVLVVRESIRLKAKHGYTHYNEREDAEALEAQAAMMISKAERAARSPSERSASDLGVR